MTTLSNLLPGWFKRKTEHEAGDGEPATTASVTTGGGSEQVPVVVWEAANLLEAEVVKGRLASEGIPAMIRSEALQVLYGFFTGGLASSTVLVPAPLADKALEILYPDEEEDGTPGDEGS